MSTRNSIDAPSVILPTQASATLLEACLDLVDATSFITLERRLDRWLTQLYAVAAWKVVWLDQTGSRQFLELHGGQDLAAKHDESIGQSIALPLQVCGRIHGELILRFPYHQLPRAERVAELAQLTSILAKTLHHTQQELLSLTHTAELFFARAVLQGEASPKAQPDLSRLAHGLLDHLDLSAFYVVIDPLGSGGLSWGASSRRSGVPFSAYERKQLLQLASRVADAKTDGTRSNLIARHEEVHELAAEYDLQTLTNFQSLLLAPIIKDHAVIGTIIAGEERHWSRQPIPRLGATICNLLANKLVDALTHSELVREVTTRHQFIQAFIDGLDEAVIVTQHDVIMLWNQAAAALFGYRAEEVCGQCITDVLPNVPAGVKQAINAPAQRIATSKVEWHMQTIGGRELDLRCALTQLDNVDSDSPLVMLAFKKTSYEPEFAYLKDELLSIISHELRTPLNGINGFGRLLLERPYMSEAMRKEALATLQSSIDRLNRMASDFIDVAQARRQLLPIEMDDIQIRDVVRAAVRDQRHRHPDRNITLRIQKQLPVIRGDSLRIKQILDNLVSNAAKYSDPSQPIRIHVRHRADVITVSVSDRSPGIPKAIQQRIFESFYRGEQGGKRQVGGVGLGLSLVKSLVQAHRGNVTVRSVQGKGSTFTFTLPIAAERQMWQLAAA